MKLVKKIPYIGTDYAFESAGLDKLGKLDYIEKLLTKQVEEKLKQRNKVEYVNKENAEILPQREVLLHKANTLLDRLRNEFDDLLNRLEIISLLKIVIHQIKSCADKNTEKYYYRACIIIHDSILHIKSEELTIKQVDTLQYLINKLKQKTIDKEEYYDIDTILVENNLDWVPALEVDN